MTKNTLIIGKKGDIVRQKSAESTTRYTCEKGKISCNLFENIYSRQLTAVRLYR